MEPGDSDKHRDKIRKSVSSTSNRPTNADKPEESDTEVGMLLADDEPSYRLPTQEELKMRMFPESYSVEENCTLTENEKNAMRHHQQKYNLLYEGYELERQPDDAEVVDSDSELEDNADEGRIEEHRRNVEKNEKPRRDYLEKYFPKRMEWIRQRDMYKKEIVDGEAEIGEDSELEENADALRIEEHKRNRKKKDERRSDLWKKLYPPNGNGNLLMLGHNRYHPDSGEEAVTVVKELGGKLQFCGVETDHDYDGYPPLNSNISAGFKFILCPLMDPNYRPSLVNASENVFVPPLAASKHTLTPDEWRTQIVGKISSWIDLDSEDETLRKDSEIILEQQIAWASQLNVEACLLPTPKGGSCANYARCTSQILKKFKHMRLLLRIQLEKTDGDSERDADQLSGGEYDSWETWSRFRLLCGNHSHLSVCLDILPSLPSINSIGRWFGERLSYAIISTNSFLKSASGYPFLSKSHKWLITALFNHEIRIVISPRSEELKKLSEMKPTDLRRSYLNCIAKLYLKTGPGIFFEKRFDKLSRDFLYVPSVRNRVTSTYTDELVKDVKYIQYKKAVAQALLEKISDEASGTTIVLIVVGFGCAPLVRLSLEAAEETGRKLTVYAVERNPDVILSLRNLVVSEGWVEKVTVVSREMRSWVAPEKADILVTELLGSFGDNQLSSEFIDGAQRFLKEGGISIPSSYTSYIQPVTATKLYECFKDFKKPKVARFETPYEVKLHLAARLVPCQPLFTFTHPEDSTPKNNQRYKKLRFVITRDTGAAIVHGFAGYFDAVLYKDIHLGIDPSTTTPNRNSWLQFYFPLRTPVCVRPGLPLELHMWRCCSETKVWYEWCVTSPDTSPVHNSNGSSYSVKKA